MTKSKVRRTISRWASPGDQEAHHLRQEYARSGRTGTSWSGGRVAMPCGRASKRVRSAGSRASRSSTVPSPQTLGSCLCACASGDSRKSATTSAAAL